MTLRFVDGIGGSTLLNLDDGTNYYRIDGCEFPLPEVLYDWVQNANVNGRRLADWSLEGNTITLKLCIKGSDEEDTYDKLRTLIKRLLKENTLEVRQWGATSSVFYHTYPALPTMPDLDRKFIIDANYITDVTIEIPVDVEVKTSAETITVVETLGDYDSFDSWHIVGFWDEPDGWDETHIGAGYVEQEPTYFLAGTSACRLNTTAAGADVAAVTDADYIAVDSTHYHNLQVHAREDSGTANAEVDLACYDASDALLGTLALLANYDPPTSDVWELICNAVISPVGGDAPAFPAGTTKVKRTVRNNAAVASVLTVDKLVFADTEYLTDHKVSGAMGIHVPPTDTKGDIAALCDAFVDVVYDRFTDAALCQKKKYAQDFNPVQELTGGTQALNYKRRSGDYRVISPLSNLLTNPGFENEEGGGHAFAEDNTDDWDDWAETRSAVGGELMCSDDAEYYEGTHSLKIGNTGAGTFDCSMLHDLFAVDPAETHYFIAAYKSSRTFSFMFETVTLAFEVYFYDAGSNLLGSVPMNTVIAGGFLTFWQRATSRFYVHPDDFPVGTTQASIHIHATGDIRSAGYIFVDDLVFGETTAVGAQAELPVESHMGKAFVSAGVSFGGSTIYDTLTIQALLQTSDGEEITGSIKPQDIDTGNPNPDFKETYFLTDKAKLKIPSHGVSSYADLTSIEEAVRLISDPHNGEDAWWDHITLLYYCGAMTELNNWVDKDHVIFDSRSSGNVLVSLDGTLDKSQAYDHTKWKGPCKFFVSPDGINMTFLAIKDVDGDHELTPVVAIKLVYNPTYLLVKT